MIGFWAFSLFRVLTGMVALGLGVLATATAASALSAGSFDALGARQWVGLTAVLALYLLPFALFSFALWPRLWPFSAAAVA